MEMGNGMDSEKKGEHAWKNGERDGSEDRSYLLPICLIFTAMKYSNSKKTKI